MRAPRPRVLIVCEGDSEVKYFEEIRQYYHLPEVNMLVAKSALGTQPQKVVNAAEDFFRRRGKVFDFVFAVFDCDSHDGFENAQASAASKHKKLKNDVGMPLHFQAIPSVPCFEIWILLKFKTVEVLIDRHQAFELVKKEVKSYEKAMDDLYEVTKHKLDEGKKNAQKCREKCEKKNGDFVFTDLDLLIGKLDELFLPNLQ